MASPVTRKRPVKYLLLVLLGLALGLLVAEVVLRVFGYPRFYKAHSSPPQFTFLPLDSTNFVCLNTPSTQIRFVYDGNPRGYFGTGSQVDHTVNSAGFRGPEFTLTKPAHVLRIACLGDSITFGEGVRDDDTYSERLATRLGRALSARDAICESCNFGVGGYNTGQELLVLRNYALLTNPDIVVVGYNLNDAEPLLFQISRLSGQPVRRSREHDIPEGLDDPLPPRTILFRSRIVQLLWQRRNAGARTAQTVRYYQDLYAAGSQGWQDSRQALRDIIATCEARKIPCIVVVFPVLYQLDDSYPFLPIHAMIQQEVASANGICIDLFPLLKGRDAAKLWVHPTDPHPNEIVHAVVAEAIAARIAETGRFQGFPGK